MMAEEKSLKQQIKDFYLNGGTYEESEIDFGKPQGEEYFDWTKNRYVTTIFWINIFSILLSNDSK